MTTILLRPPFTCRLRPRYVALNILLSASPSMVVSHHSSPQVIKRCQHYIGDDSPHTRMLALDTVRHCISVLARHETQLLPSAHLVWAPLVRASHLVPHRNHTQI